MRMAVALLAGLLVVVLVFFKRLNPDVTDQGITFEQTCRWDPPLERGGIQMYGSVAINPRGHSFVLRSYLIDNGEKTLKGSIPVNSEAYPAIYLTPVSDRENGSLVSILGPVATGVSLPEGKDLETIQETVEFPAPYMIQCPVRTASTSAYGQVPGKEELLLSFTLLETDQTGGKAVSTIDEMVAYSKVDPTSFLVFTWEEK